MGCCCFNTLRGAAFFVASIHIYNGLECMLKFIAFPIVFSSMHDKDNINEYQEVPFINFLPGMGYAILYFFLGCTIFRGIERESMASIKWGSVGFAITEIVFFILKQVLKVIPLPNVPDLPKNEQPFEMNIYKTLYYFLFTIVGGIVYICILFLYLQKLSSGQDEFAQFFNITTRSSTTPPRPTTTTQNAQPAAVDPATGGSGSAAVTTSSSNPLAQGNPSNSRSSNSSTSKPKHGHSHSSHTHHQSSSSSHPHHPKPLNDGQSQHMAGSRKPRMASSQGQATPVPPPPAGSELPAKDPVSPSSPMFPYFLIRRNSKINASNKSSQDQRLIIDDPPPSVWHQHQHQRGQHPMPVPVVPPPPMRPEFVDSGTPRSDATGRNLLSPSRLVNHHQQPHQFQPIIPPFYPESADERRESYVGAPFQSPASSHAGYAGPPSYPPPPPRGPDSLYQKIPLSPGAYDYCLR